MDQLTASKPDLKTDMSNFSSPTKTDSVSAEEYERDMLKLSQDIVSMHQNQRKQEKVQKKSLEKMQEQVETLQNTVALLLEREKSSKQFNEMNIQKINDLEH